MSERANRPRNKLAENIETKVAENVETKDYQAPLPPDAEDVPEDENGDENPEEETPDA